MMRLPTRPDTVIAVDYESWTEKGEKNGKKGET